MVKDESIESSVLATKVQTYTVRMSQPRTDKQTDNGQSYPRVSVIFSYVTRTHVVKVLISII